MIKLLWANLFRLKKQLSFWLISSFSFILGGLIPLVRYLDMKKTGTITYLDNGFFLISLLVGITGGIFCSLFTSTDFSDGTIRNKIIVGHHRSHIYFAHFLTAALANSVVSFAYFLAYIVVGRPLLGEFQSKISFIMTLVGVVFLLGIAFCALFTMVAMLNPNKTVVAVICLLTAFGTLVAGGMTNKMLSEPKENTVYLLNDQGEKEVSQVPNEKYLTGKKKEFVQFLHDANPGAQGLQLATLEVVHPKRLPVYSLLIIVVTSCIGLVFFQKKDLK